HVEAQAAAAGPLAPLSHRDTAAVVPPWLSAGGERRELMLAVEEGGTGAKRAHIERPPQGPLEGPPKRRRGGVVGADIVAVASGEGALPGVKPRLHRLDRGGPAIAGQQGVERAPEVGGGPLIGSGKADAEPFRVYPGVGSARRVGGRSGAEQPFQHALELGLDRTAGRLALPPDKPGAVEEQRGEEGPPHR